jgi:hypothetical protein
MAQFGEPRVAGTVRPRVAQERHVDQLGVRTDRQPEDIVRNAGEASAEKLILDYDVWVVTHLSSLPWANRCRARISPKCRRGLRRTDPEASRRVKVERQAFERLDLSAVGLERRRFENFDVQRSNIPYILTF